MIRSRAALVGLSMATLAVACGAVVVEPVTSDSTPTTSEPAGGRLSIVQLG